MNQRTCVTCGLTKDLTSEFFYPSCKHEGGFNTQCRKCNIAKTIAQEKALREANPDFNPNSKTEKRRQATAREFARKREIDEMLYLGLAYCSACKSWLPVEDFHNDARSYTGLASVCKACKKQRSLKKDKAKD